MNTRQNTVVSRFALFVGAFLVFEGIWELFSPVAFVVMTSNKLHGAVHILLGATGVATGLRGGARRFCIFLGALLLVVDVVWSIPATKEFVVSLFNVNQPVAIMNLIVAIACLAVAFSSRRND